MNGKLTLVTILGALALISYVALASMAAVHGVFDAKRQHLEQVMTQIEQE